MATAIPVQRPAITPVPPLMEGQMAGTLEKWLPQLITRVYGQKIDTQTPAVASGTSTPVLVIPKSWGLWLVTVGIGRVSDAINYQAAMLVFVDGLSSRAVNVLNAPVQTIGLNGLTVSVVQSSGGPQVVTATAVQLTNF